MNGLEPSLPPVVWTSLLYDRSGYADEARSFVLALDRAGVQVHPNPADFGLPPTRLPEQVSDRIRDLMSAPAPDRFVHVTHFTAETFRRNRRALLNVGRTMFETDGLPPYAVAKCNEMDEVWVPSDFNLETFARAGVDRSRLHKVPQGIDIDRYHPGVAPLELALPSGFVFLSVMEWGRRKGWDLLLRAYFEEFGRRDAVVLLLKITPAVGRTFEDARRELERFVREDLGRDPARGPRLVLLDRNLPAEDMPRLYRAADAYVMPSRGEGWGRPYMEAMAMGLPVIGTRWSGNLEFMTDETSFLLDYEVVDVPPTSWREAYLFGHRWAEPSVEHLRALMRRVFEDRDEGAERGRRAREEVAAKFTWDRVAETVIDRLAAVAEARDRAGRRPAKTPPLVVWEGNQFVQDSLAIVNRELCRQLVDSPRIDLRLRSDHPMAAGGVVDPRLAELAGLPPDRQADVHVRHFWPPRFDPPPEGRWVMIQPWEYGSLPVEWVDRINDLVDEVWVPSSYVRDCYVRSGVDPDRVVVVPNGVHPGAFHAAIRPFDLPTAKSFRFLFVGGTIPRKGADILLETYLAAFGPDDDVCLVVKDFGTDSFYRGQGQRYRVLEAQAHPGNPEILYTDEELPMEQMGRLYNACHALVHPYRGEGFGIPIAEAMACGLPVIVPDHGACLDFCDPATAYLVPAREVRFTERQVGGVPTVDHPWVAEVDRDALAAAMRRVVEHPEEARLVGRRASRRIHGRFTWARAASVVVDRVEALAGRPTRRSGRAVSRASPMAYPFIETETVAPASGGSMASRHVELSVCLVVRDEEERLAACLESVRGLGDEIVVVDTGSTDRTVDVARAHGARVVRAPWTDDFSAVRNVYLDHATKDWILVLDADNVLDGAAHEEIRRLIRTDELIGYAPTQRSPLGEDGGSVLEHREVRLFPNHPDLRYVGRIHSQVLPRRPDLPFRVVPCDVVIYHLGYRRSTEQAGAARERYARVLEDEVRSEPDEPFHAYNLGVAYQLLGRHAEAERLFLRAIRGCRPHLERGEAPLFALHAHVLLAQALIDQGRPHEAEECCRRVLAVTSGWADAHCTLAVALAGLGRLEEALAEYRLALRHAGDSGPWPTDRSIGTWKALLGMGAIHLLQGRPADARSCFDRAAEASPDNPEVLAALARAREAEATGS